MIRTKTYRELFILKELLEGVHIEEEQKKKAIYSSLDVIIREHGELLNKLTNVCQVMEDNMVELSEIIRDNE